MGEPYRTFRNIEDCVQLLGRDFLNFSLYEFKSALDGSSVMEKTVVKGKKKDDLSADMKYLDNLIRTIHDLGGNTNVTKEANSAINFLSDRQEFC